METYVMRMLATCIGLIFFGFITLGVWGVGSHGNIMFRPRMVEDWVFATLLVFSWGLPVLIASIYVYGRVADRRK